AAGQPATDAGGGARADDPDTPNTGAGPRAYDDRGAFEFQPADAAPSARLTVQPSSGGAPLPVTADASGSSDTDATPIATYQFDFGDGTKVGPQASATASHVFASAGSFTVAVTVADTGGLSSTATGSVRALLNMVKNSGFEKDLSGWVPYGKGVKLARVSGG